MQRIKNYLKSMSLIEKVFILALLIPAIYFGVSAILSPDLEHQMWREIAISASDVCSDGEGITLETNKSSNNSNSIVIAHYETQSPVLGKKTDDLREAAEFLPEELIPTLENPPGMIACIHTKSEIVQVCEYINGPDVTRYFMTTHITIRALETGEVIHEKDIAGGSPKDCNKTEASTTTSIFGSSATDEEIATEVSKLIFDVPEK